MRIIRGLPGLLGEVLITVGAMLVLFVGWQLWWTDVVADADADKVVTTLQREFVDPGWARPGQVKLGDAYAIIRVPRFGPKFARPLYEGTDTGVLQRGIGHYVATAAPGQVGNFAMAGHRTTYGKPFNKINRLANGDVVLVETADTYYVYRVSGHQIVAPAQVSVLLPVPDRPGVGATVATLTMTSCEPEYSARQRYVVHAELDRKYPRSHGIPPEVLRVGG